MKKIFLLSSLIIITFSMCKKDKKNSVATITTNAINNLTATSAQSGGTITDDGGSAIIKKGVCYANHSGPTVSDSITNDETMAVTFVSNLTGLSANTVYYVKAYAINATGTAYGNELSFTTSPGAATLTTLSISDIVALSAKSGGNITNDGGAPITERGVVYATNQIPTTSDFKISASTGTGMFTATMSPLASNQTYYVRSYAINSYGTAYGKQLQFNAASANTVTDVSGNVYPYVTVGAQSWMSANLKITKYRNGDPITNAYAVSNFNWSTATEGAYTFPGGIPSKKDTFGLFYNYLVITDSRGVCPTGWHVPSDNEWKTLEVNQGMLQADADILNYRGTIATKLKEGGSTGVNLQLSGFYSRLSTSYLDLNNRGYFFTSTNSGVAANSFYYRAVQKNGDVNESAVYRNYGSNIYAIRCVKD